MSSPDRKLLKEFYRYFPDVVIKLCDLSSIGRRHWPDTDVLISRPRIDLWVPSKI
jgi:hypothetical protein